MNGEAGKGSSPRVGQHSPRSTTAFSLGYERAFGIGCQACKDNTGRSRGYFWDEDQNGNLIKHTCLLCKGTGRQKNDNKVD